MKLLILYRSLFEYGWLMALTRGNPSGFFSSLEKRVEVAQGEKFGNDYLKVRIEPNVVFKQGIPIYSKPNSSLAGFGSVHRGLGHHIMVLGIGTEFVITAIHEYLHILFPTYGHQKTIMKHPSLSGLGGESYRKQLHELERPWENLIELTAQTIVWDWHTAGDITWDCDILTQ